MQVDIQGTAGRLEAILEEPLAAAGAAAAFAAVVCHPDPRFGGTMHNHATYRLAKAVQARGGAALRFNFRGVGLSAGRWDEGRGETDDARAALAWLARERPALPLLACGFSFGSWTAAAAGGPDPRVEGLLLAGIALRAPSPSPPSPSPPSPLPSPPSPAGGEGILAGVAPLQDAAWLRDIEKPIAIVQAEEDELTSPAELRDAIAGSRAPRRLAAVAGASHLFTQDLGALQREAEDGIAWLRGEAP